MYFHWCVYFIHVTCPLQSLPKNAILWGMNKPERDKSFRPKSINLRRKTDCNSSQSSLNYWSTGIKEVKYWFHASQSNLNNFHIWNESSTPRYFVFNQITTWSKVSTPLIFTFATPIQNWNETRILHWLSFLSSFVYIKWNLRSGLSF